ncbi:hypothetical protein [Streptomyces acidiscabies]|uniref:Uncharacterized protein n=1 Tax=Streptomyces acidiscabies TaxID=42234 RepID=A0AAP6BIH8_9ACTN|nr:hypothetical protein [Streptomyces acidiscabies]MBP5938593.1 hypothetical protein [Streptomyces sp. LBUM 1476]MBZ3909689.1 hypothetical protein [Streptomyces acidiscabies]MDX2965349.1 hypothetical protein [Streptomyces acidiscabies]MDX3024582.1 hypothetical protein [Streptomyces acidiscabies]MDX3795183.1 hypothetical protein [Streptomyces acidiscabies]
MSQNSDAPEVHHNVFTGPTVIGGTQNLVGVTPVQTSLRPSMLSQVWTTIMLVWALCPMAAWWTQSVPDGELFSRLADLVHAATLYIWLAGGVALFLDAMVYLLYRHWPVVQRAITHPVTWKLRLLAVALGGVALATVIFMSGQ